MILCICMYLFYIPRTQMTPILKGQPPQTRPFPIKTGVIWVLGIYIYYVDSIAIASRYIQHFDKATDGGQRLSWLSKILQVLRKKGPEKRICSFQSFCFTVPPNWKVSESWSFAMCNTAPWPISHSPTAWPSPSDGGRYRKAVVQGLDERCSRIQHCVMKTKAKEKDTHPKVCQ